VADSITGGASFVASSHTSADLRVNWSRNRAFQAFALEPFGGAVVPLVSDVFAPGRQPSDAQAIFAPPGTVGFTWGQDSDKRQRQINVVGAVVSQLGPHELKLGVDYRRLLPVFTSGGSILETLAFSSAQGLTTGTSSF